MDLELNQGYSGLKVSNLRKSYNSRLVLRDVSLTLHQREIVALLGANGTGKTTCFYSIAGLTSLDSGNITLNGTNISNMPIPPSKVKVQIDQLRAQVQEEYCAMLSSSVSVISLILLSRGVILCDRYSSRHIQALNHVITL